MDGKLNKGYHVKHHCFSSLTDPSPGHTGRTKRNCRQSKFTTPHNSPLIAESHACSHRTNVALVKGSKHPGKPSVLLRSRSTSVFLWVINFFSHSLRSLARNQRLPVGCPLFYGWSTYPTPPQSNPPQK